MRKDPIFSKINFRVRSKLFSSPQKIIYWKPRSLGSHLTIQDSVPNNPWSKTDDQNWYAYFYRIIIHDSWTNLVFEIKLTRRFTEWYPWYRITFSISLWLRVPTLMILKFLIQINIQSKSSIIQCDSYTMTHTFFSFSISLTKTMLRS